MTPFFAATMPGVPETSPSMNFAPFCCNGAIWRFLSGTGCEPSSMTICPGFAVCTSPAGPCMASSSASVEGRHENTISVCAPTSAADRAGTPPIFSNSASEERRNPTTRYPLLMRFSEIGRPILPTPTKPMVSIVRFLKSLFLCHFDRLIGEIDPHAERAFHDGPFLELECAQPVDEERIALGERARFVGVLGAQHGQALAGRRPFAVGKRPGREHQAALFQADHVFEMRREERLQFIRRHRRLRQHDIELLAQHFARQVGNTLFKKHDSSLRFAVLSLRMVSSENRYPLFGVMLYTSREPCGRPRKCRPIAS